jgi:hypothetical protein
MPALLSRNRWQMPSHLSGDGDARGNANACTVEASSRDSAWFDAKPACQAADGEGRNGARAGSIGLLVPIIPGGSK